MTEPTLAAMRRALAGITSRRTVVGAAVAGSAGALVSAPGSDAKKKKKRKKRCKNGAKRCGKGCCKAPSICSVASCFCTGNEGKCKSVPAELIAIIAEALGVPPEQIGANPDDPLAQCPEIPGVTKENVDLIIEKEFGVTGQAPWCEDGITAGVDFILDRLKEKA